GGRAARALRARLRRPLARLLPADDAAALRGAAALAAPPRRPRPRARPGALRAAARGAGRERAPRLARRGHRAAPPLGARVSGRGEAAGGDDPDVDVAVDAEQERARVLHAPVDVGHAEARLDRDPVAVEGELRGERPRARLAVQLELARDLDHRRL